MKFIRSLYLHTRLFILLAANIVLFTLGFFFPLVYIVAQIFFIALALFFFLDILLVYGRRQGISARRITGDKLSNGDNNPIYLKLESDYPYPVFLQVIDEMPEQLQSRNTIYHVTVGRGQEKTISYTIRPTKRGEYHFGFVNVYVSSILSLVRKRMKLAGNQMVPVYPSFLQMRKYELMAISNRLTEVGVKKIRRIGQTMEFDQIRDYVRGDDIRTINWKATAHKADLMVNQYQQEKSQQVYCIIDKGRVMKMPFEGMSLLDYAINASLVLSNIAQLKQDKPGVITFSEKVGTFLPAERKGMQMRKIQEVLYNQKTRYLESDYERLYALVKTKITTRSLLIIFTNFESLSALRRQLPYFRMMAKSHLLVVVFFENTELRSLTESEAHDIQSVYTKTIAEKFAFEKKLIAKELTRFGIHAILSPPAKLTVNTLNKYLEMKARNLI